MRLRQKIKREIKFLKGLSRTLKRVKSIAPDSPNLICDDLDGEVIAIDLESGRYYRMTGAARDVWTWVTGGATAAEVAGGCDDPCAADAVTAFVDRLADLSLIRPAAPAPDGRRGGPPGPWELTDLDVEVFSDLEDILGLDPIHEVDPQVGWTLGGRWLATSGSDQIILWPFQSKDGPMGKQPRLLAPTEQRVEVMACHPKQDIVAAGYSDGMVLLVRLEDGAEILGKKPGEAPLTALAWSADGTLLAFGTESGEAGIIDLA